MNWYAWIFTPSVLCVPFLAHAECKRAAMDLPVTISGARALMNAKINHQAVRLIVDSGTLLSTIRPEEAASLKLRTEPVPDRLSLSGIGGTVNELAIALAEPFSIGNIDIPKLEFLVTGSEIDRGSDGVLGQNFLVNWNVEYDLAKGMIRLFKDTDCSKQFLAYWIPQTHQPYTVTNIEKVTLQFPYAIANAYINEEKIRVLFDSGALKSMLSLRAARRAGIKVDSPGVIDGGVIGGVGQKLVGTYIASFASFKFADGEEIKNARLRVLDGDLGSVDMLIGADFNRTVYLSPIPKIKYISRTTAARYST